MMLSVQSLCEKRTITWSLVIPTYNRAQILKTAITLALQQSWPPSEIIVIDSSADWSKTRDEVLAETQACSTRLHYVGVEAHSSAKKRNLGLQLATSDIVFLLDDDSLMFPDCAERIMELYEKDEEHVIAGIQANLSNEIPEGAKCVGARKVSGNSGTFNSQDNLGRIRRWLWRNLLLMDAVKLFVPYDGAYYWRAVPPFLSSDSVQQEVLFHGCRMTFRRNVISSERFNQLMLSYCPGEDLDASYRVARHGILLTATKAFLHHYQSEAGRIDRHKVSLLTTMNQAMCLRLNASDQALARQQFNFLMVRKLFAECLKDLLSCRWKFPQASGVLSATRITPTIFSMSEDQLYRHYPAMQEQVLMADSRVKFRTNSNLLAKESGNTINLG